MFYLLLASLLFPFHSTFSKDTASCGYANPAITFNKDCLPNQAKLKNTVIIINQWHPSTKVDATDIKKSKKLPQYINQIDIYNKVKRLIDNGTVSTVIAEGCEGDIDEKFTKRYYGWDFKKLVAKKSDKNYEQILAHIPTKIKVKYPKSKVICGDNELLVEENLLAYSELNGFVGYLMRLTQYKKNKKKFKLYSDSLLESAPNKKVDPIDYAKNKALESLNKFKEVIEKRNNIFLKTMQSNKDSNIALVIGGLHTKGIAESLKKAKRPFIVINPSGYQSKDIELIGVLEDTLKNY